MSRNTKLASILLVLVATTVVCYVFNARTPVPGHGQRAEIIDPDTHARTATTWDKVWPLKPVQSPVNGYWLVRYPPNTGKWSYVVNPGARDPTPPTPPREQP